MFYSEGDELYAEYSVYSDSFKIYGLRRKDGKRFVLKAVEDDEYKESAMGSVIEPTVSLIRERAQQLFDNLWHAGLRPVSRKDEEPAKDKHIEDLRKIAFHSLGITK